MTRTDIRELSEDVGAVVCERLCPALDQLLVVLERDIATLRRQREILGLTLLYSAEARLPQPPISASRWLALERYDDPDYHKHTDQKGNTSEPI